MKADAPKKSGSLIILRGNNYNYQVLMLKRHQGMTFGNMYSFPGGKLEESDYLDSLKHSDEINKTHQQFYDSKNSWYPEALIASIRETYEETGILFHNKNEQIELEQSFKNFNQYKPLVRIITPYVLLKNRFDTQFFITSIGNNNSETQKHYGLNKYNVDNPLDLDSLKLTDESVSYLWETPQNILTQCFEGKIQLPFPTIFILLLLYRLTTQQQVFQFIEVSQNGFSKHPTTFPNQFQFISRTKEISNFVMFPDKNYNLNEICDHEKDSYLKKELETYLEIPKPQGCIFEFKMELPLVSITTNVSAQLMTTPFGFLNGNLVQKGKLVDMKPKL